MVYFPPFYRYYIYLQKGKTDSIDKMEEFL